MVTNDVDIRLRTTAAIGGGGEFARTGLMARPIITGRVLTEVFGDVAEMVKRQFVSSAGPGSYALTACLKIHVQPPSTRGRRSQVNQPNTRVIWPSVTVNVKWSLPSGYFKATFLSNN